MQSDIEEMRSSGGYISGTKILGKKLEEVEESEKEQIKQSPTEEKRGIFSEVEADNETQIVGSLKKSKTLPIIITIVAILILGGAGAYFFVFSNKKEGTSTPTPIPMPQFSSLLKNFSGETELVIYQGNLSNLERLISQSFQKSIVPDIAKEIGLMQDDYNIFPAQSFLKSAYDNFTGVNSSEIPNFENKFSFIVYDDAMGKNSIAYTLKINEQGLNSFTIANIKTKFNTVFEKFIEENSNILSSQYLQNLGNPQKPFLNKELGAVNARYLKFSTGSEFYYGFYQNYLVIATSQNSFQKIMELLLPKL